MDWSLYWTILSQVNIALLAVTYPITLIVGASSRAYHRHKMEQTRTTKMLPGTYLD